MPSSAIKSDEATQPNSESKEISLDEKIFKLLNNLMAYENEARDGWKTEIGDSKKSATEIIRNAHKYEIGPPIRTDISIALVIGIYKPIMEEDGFVTTTLGSRDIRIYDDPEINGLLLSANTGSFKDMFPVFEHICRGLDLSLRIDDRHNNVFTYSWGQGLIQKSSQP